MISARVPQFDSNEIRIPGNFLNRTRFLRWLPAWRIEAPLAGKREINLRPDDV